MVDATEVDRKSVDRWLKRAHESLHVARTLHQLDGSNGSTVHFAFYSMLYAVFAMLVPYQVEKGVDKDDLTIAFFDEKFVKPNIISKDLSRKIHDAYELRQANDFQPFFQITREQVLETLNASETFIKSIEEKLTTL